MLTTTTSRFETNPFQGADFCNDFGARKYLNSACAHRKQLNLMRRGKSSKKKTMVKTISVDVRPLNKSGNLWRTV